jgi:hypothetical protein
MPATQMDFVQIVAAYWSKVERSDGCWIWKGAISGERYGQFSLYGERVKAHRFSFLLAHGYWPAHEIDHLCHEKLCQRAEHLRDVTHLENINNRRCSKICKRGHPLADPNLYYTNTKKFGVRRRCLTCWKAEQERLRIARIAAKAAAL